LINHGLKPVATNITPLTGLKAPLPCPSPQERGINVTNGVEKDNWDYRDGKEGNPLKKGFLVFVCKKYGRGF